MRSITAPPCSRTDDHCCGVLVTAAGKAFGEVALMNEDSVRTASIISDEDCDLMVINRTVYNATLKVLQSKRCLEHTHTSHDENKQPGRSDACDKILKFLFQHHLEREFAEKRDFIDSCVLFISAPLGA